ILGLTGTGLALVIVALTGFVWPGFFLSSGGHTELLAFVPPQCDVVAGANLTALRSRPGTMGEIDQVAQMLTLNPAQVELIKTADRGVVAVAKTSQQAVIAFTCPNPVEVEKVRQAFNAGPPELTQGKFIYPVQAAFGKNW